MSSSGASISLAEYHQMKAGLMSEAQLQAAIVASAERHGWLVYHTYDSRRSEPGYPDLHLVHPDHGIAFMRELKKQSGTTTKDQKKWIAALEKAGVDVAVWRPIDWFDGTIDKQLDPRPVQL